MEKIFEKVAERRESLKNLPTDDKNAILKKFAEELVARSDKVIAANAEDMKIAKEAGLSSSMLDRLKLDEKRVKDMADGLISIAALNDPVGEVVEEWTAESGIVIKKTRIPIGVIGVIYEARPNVTSDVIGLCLKTGNACVLKGGKEAYNTNKAILDAFYMASGDIGEAFALLPATRDATDALIHAKGYIDLVIPRGGKGLIKFVTENATVPYIETGAGVCHVYVEKTADFGEALNILVNAKCSRPSVCNAAETLLVDEEIADEFIPAAIKTLTERNVKFYGNAETAEKYGVEDGGEDVYYNEYDDLKMSVKTVKGVSEAVEHIRKYGTNHSECICTRDSVAAEYFMNALDSACVYLNASTRFTDGGCFGFGAELGISTQKLHARGPMGLKEMTTYHYKIYGKGQIR